MNQKIRRRKQIYGLIIVLFLSCSSSSFVYNRQTIDISLPYNVSFLTTKASLPQLSSVKPQDALEITPEYAESLAHFNAIKPKGEDGSNHSYVPHEPINIVNDEDWKNYNFPGSGTKHDPYRISGYNITTANTFGIKIVNTSKSIIIQHCYISSAEEAIFLSHVSSSEVIDNILISSYIVLSWSTFSVIANNTCYEGSGVDISYSHTILISQNSCDRGSIAVSDSSVITISSNYVNNSSWDSSGIDIIRCTNAVIYNNTVSYNDWGGIYCGDSINIMVRANFCLNNPFGDGVHFDNVTRGYITDNICIDNIQNNIWINNCIKTVIIGNRCVNTHRFYHWYGDILGWGIVITSDFEDHEDCNDILIEANECGNLTYGIALLHNNGSITVRNNYVWNCYNAGIRLYHQNNTIITYNILLGNTYAISIEYDDDYLDIYLHRIELWCYNNILHHNNFIENNPGGSSQAYDDGINTQWYDIETHEGNYWSDCNGTGVYYIDGSASSVDPYPLPSLSTYISSTSLFEYWWFDFSLLFFSSLFLFSLVLLFRRLRHFLL